MTVEPMTDADLDAIGKRRHYTAGLGVGVIVSADDWTAIRARIAAERTRADAAEAERDAALARAMPEPRFMATEEDVEALPLGLYRVLGGWSPGRSELWVKADRDTWGPFDGLSCDEFDEAMVGATVLGPLPDLPTPTAAQ